MKTRSEKQTITAFKAVMVLLLISIFAVPVAANVQDC